MPYHVELRFAAKTDAGRVRSRNEDAIAFSPEYGAAILADGMGGYNAGEVASSIATSVMTECIEGQLRNFDWSASKSRTKRLRRVLIDAFETANNAILDAANSETSCRGMGTTIVAALFHHDRALIAHMGDSRAYRWRQAELTLLTHDHSVLQEQVDAGLIDAEQARFSPDRNIVTRAVGLDGRIEVELHEHAIMAGDILLLCSDGLSDMLSSQEISSILRAADTHLDATCDALVARANANGGRDNISVILVQIQRCDSDAEDENVLQKVMNWLR